MSEGRQESMGCVEILERFGRVSVVYDGLPLRMKGKALRSGRFGLELEPLVRVVITAVMWKRYLG